MTNRSLCGAALAAVVFLADVALAIPPPAGPDPSATAPEPADLSQLRDITGIEKTGSPPSSRSWLLWLGIASVSLCGFLVVVWKWSRRNGRATSSVPPEQWALSELESIERLGLPAAGEVERYHTLLSDVMRRYWELRLHLPASHQTTPEFLKTLSSSGPLTPPQQHTLAAFLERCDLAKFARASFSAEECAATAQMARELVEQTSAPMVGAG
jgi:hypothetical protein